MDLIAIDYFMQIAKGQTLETVAEHNFLSTSALSKAIQTLEKDMGITLFSRSSRSLSLTREGLRLYENLLPLHSRYISAVDTAIRKPALHIAAYLGFSVLGLMKTLNAFERDFNEPLKLLRIAQNDAFEELRNREFDFLFAYTAGVGKEFVEISLSKVDIVAVTTNRHPLSSKNNVTFEDLLSLSKCHSKDRIERTLLLLLSDLYPDARMQDCLSVGTTDEIAQTLYRGGLVFMLKDLRLRSFPDTMALPVVGAPQINLSLIHLANAQLTANAQSFKDAIPRIYPKYSQ